MRAIFRAGFLLMTGVGMALAQSQAGGILNLAKSPKARIQNVPVSSVQLGDGFWAERRKVNAERSIPTLLQLLEENGIADNFRRLSKKKETERKGPLYTDSDLYKWMEAAAFVLQTAQHPELQAKLDALIEDVLAAQEPSGYLNTYYTGERKRLRFQEMQRGHELYCLGHMLQAGIAYYRATGNKRLLDGGIKFANYLEKDFGPRKKPLLTGHPGLEMALVELYRTTGEKSHLRLAAYLLQGDAGRLNLSARDLVYMFSGKPFTSRSQFEGHAVRALYAASGAADYYLETGDEAYWKTLENLWTDLTSKKMYVTGGVGSRSSGESFGDSYELPNGQAYAESCAAIANVMFQWRMLAATGDARFSDVLERALYNGVNSGMSIDGTQYCYRNPLEHSGNPADKIRNPWYNTTCCPPNLERILASLPGYFYGIGKEGLWVHLYHNNELNTRLADGTELKVAQATDYPWDDRVQITVSPARPREFTMNLRVPGWSRTAQISVNGKMIEGEVLPGQYMAIRRQWQADDRILLTLDIGPHLVAANPRVRENFGRAALQRGPLVYALEGLDQPEGVQIFDAGLDLRQDPNKSFVPEFMPKLLGGVLILKHKGFAYEQPLSAEPLYGHLGREDLRPSQAVELRFIPYYAFANREPTPMVVWLPFR